MQIKRYLKPILILEGLSLLILFFYFFPNLISGNPHLFSYDIIQQWQPFYNEFSNIIHESIYQRSLPFYSFNLFLGSDFFSSKTYYLMGDIFAYFSLLLPFSFPIVHSILIIIKHLVASLTMYLLLKEWGFKDKTAIIGGLLYSFSAWAIFFNVQWVFLSFYALFPLYLLGIDYAIKKNKYLLFYVMAFSLLIMNWYLFFIVSILSPIYYLYRYYNIYSSLKKALKPILSIVFIYIIAALSTAIFTLPTILYILKGDRFATDIELFYPLEAYFNLLIAPFVPSQLFLSQQYQNVFDVGKYALSELLPYISTLFIIFLPQLLKIKIKRHDHSIIFLYLTLAIIILCPFISQIIHGNSEASFRFLFFFIPIFIIHFCMMYEHMEEIDFSLLKKSIAIIIIILSLTLSLMWLIYRFDFKTYSYQYYICLFFVLIYLGLYFIFKSKNPKKYCLIYIIMELSLTSFIYTYINLNPQYDKEYLHQTYHTLENSPGDLMSYLNSLNEDNDASFYRIYVAPSLFQDVQYNGYLNYRLKGFSTYDSTLEPALTPLKSYLLDGANSWAIDIHNQGLISFLCGKYAIVSDANELPSGDQYLLIDDNYMNGLKIYENLSYVPFGKTYTKTDSFDNFNLANLSTTIYTEQNDEVAKLVGQEEIFLNSIYYYANEIHGQYEAKESGFMVLQIPNNKGWKIMIDGIVQDEIYSVNGGFIGFSIPSGMHNIDMYFIPEGFKLGTIISFTAIILSLGLFLITKKVHPKMNQIN